MTETAASNGAAPAADVNHADYIEPLAPKPPKRNNLFSDPDAAADEALAKAKPEAKPKPRTGPPTKSERRAAEAEVDELLNDDAIGFRSGDHEGDSDDVDDDVEEEAPKPKKKKPAAEPDASPEVEEPEVDELPPEPEVGTKKRPHKREDMPEDVFVELKVDGEKHVVNLKELTDNFSGQKAIQKRLEAIAAERATMERTVNESKEEVKKNGAFFEDLIRNPDKLYEILTRTDELEATLQKLFERRYSDLDAWQKDRALRARFLYERGQKQIARERQILESQRQGVEREAQQRQVEEHRMKVIKPGWNEGLRRTGLLNTKIEHPDFTKTAQSWLMNKVGEGGMATVEDVAMAVQFAAKFLGIKPQAAPPPPRRPIIPARGEQRPQQVRRGTSTTTGKSFEQMTKHQRSMDPDYLMSGIGRRLRG